MNNQKGNQPNTAVNDQNLSNKNIDSLKEFNSTPIDTPTPVSLSENLETSNSLTEESLPVEESKPQVPPESQTESLLDPEVELKPALEINPEPKNELDQENEVIPLSEVEPQPKPNFESNSESEIQPQSEVKVELNPEPKIESPPPTIQTETKPSTPVSQDPEAIKQKIEEVLSYNTASNIADSQLNKPKTSRFLITLFILSLIIFLAIIGSLAYFLANPISKTNSETKVTPTNTPVQSSVTCELNGFVYSLNQSFPSADGCNTCTCDSADNIKCTDNPCSSDTTTPATSSSIPKDWKTYENKKIGFSIQYPAILKTLSEEDNAFLGVSFNKLQSGSPDTEDAAWEINFNSASNKKTVEEIKKEIGIQFTNKIQNEEIVVINGKINATKITTTTKESPNWYSEEIIIKDTYNNIYVISNRGISDVELNKFLKSTDIKFKDFYSSFKFI